MPLTLTDADLSELVHIINDVRHKDAVAILSFLQARIAAQQVPASPVPAMPEPPVAPRPAQSPPPAALNGANGAHAANSDDAGLETAA